MLLQGVREADDVGGTTPRWGQAKEGRRHGGRSSRQMGGGWGWMGMGEGGGRGVIRPGVWKSGVVGPQKRGVHLARWSLIFPGVVR